MQSAAVIDESCVQCQQILQVFNSEWVHIDKKQLGLSVYTLNKLFLYCIQINLDQ